MKQRLPSSLLGVIPRILCAIALAAGLAGCSSFVAFDLAQPLAWLGVATPAPAGALEASGVIEAEQVIISAELGGRIVGLYVREGQEVQAGQLLIQLDDALLKAQIAQAQAAMSKAEAELARLLAGPRPAQVAGAEAAIVQAQGRAAGAYQALEDARALRENPLSLDTQIAAAEAQVALAQAGVDRARANLSEAKVRYEASQGGGSDIEKTTAQILRLHVQAAEASVGVATAQVEGARATLAELRRLRDTPAALDAGVHQAEMAYRLALAEVEVKEAALALLKAGPQKEEIALAQRQVTLARAGVERLEVQREKLTLRAPMAGVVASQIAHEGEAALPGATLLTLADLAEVRLVIYAPATEAGRIQVGQPAEVRIDSYPDRVFVGRVIHVASQAEFTPRSVQTKEERANKVFAVKIALENPERILKPGMPADATLSIE